MFAMEKIKRCEIYAVLLSIGFLLLGGWGLIHGGAEILSYGFMNEPFPSILMVVGVGLAIVFAFFAYALGCIRKDIQQKLNYLEGAKQDVKEAEKL